MANKRLKIENGEVNFKFTCRCCLKSEAEFFPLDSLVEVGQGCDSNRYPTTSTSSYATSTKMPLMRLLLFCLRTENPPELPQFICVECSKSLQIAYYFIQNGLRAHEILCRKLMPKTRFNGLKLSAYPEKNEREGAERTRAQKPAKPEVRQECKTCGQIFCNRVKFRQHLRMHTDSSRHNCKLCKFGTLKHRQLLDHYRKVHGLTAGEIEHRLQMRKSNVAAASVTTTTTTETEPGDDSQVKVCTLEDMELLIPTVLTPEHFSHPQLDSAMLRDIEQQIANSLPKAESSSMPAEPTIAGGSGANVSVGAEFLVMPDGTLQKVNDGGVVFEYIDDSKNVNNTTNTTLQSLLSDSKTDISQDALNIDLSHMVVDNVLPQIKVKTKLRPGPASIGALKHKCKLCPKAFPTVARLKSHQLTHSHLPKFFCDQCSYYSLRSADLIQHYTTEHNISLGDNRASQADKTLMPQVSDRNLIFSCDMCLFETPSGGQLRLHYSDKHLMVPSEIQLRPSWIKERDGRTELTSGDGSIQPDIPLGITYPPMSFAETITTTTLEQQKQQHPQQPQTTTTTVMTADGDINVVVDASTLFFAPAAGSVTSGTTTTATSTDSNTFALFSEQSFANSLSTPKKVKRTTTKASASAVRSETEITTKPNTSIFGDMQEFIDNTDVAAICTIPADDMPVVDGDDIVIDNNNISLDFDTENLFEEFEDVVGEEDDEDEDDAENDDENDNNDAAADQNLLLTSDDDDVDDFDDEQSKHLQKPYCIYCNKKFTSQYKFENHMFVHRGLAPYRCELCTNLYNMKRLLIRHYKTVHKRMPTRDMVQAKGDKVSVPRTTIEKINIYAAKTPMLMCAKCPFECEVESDMRKHLNAHHGINDGVHANEVFIIRKLPYECPRCIRSFAAKLTLTQHLQRSHLVDTIIEQHAPRLTTSSASTTTTSTSTTTLPNNASDVNKTNTREEANVEDDGDGDGDCDGDGDGKCEEQAVDKDTGLETDNADTDIKTAATIQELRAQPTITTTASTTARQAKTKCTVATATTTEAEVAAATATTTMTTEFSPTTIAGTTLFPTPTPFDFDLDFMGDEAHATLLKSHNDSFDAAPSPSLLLNGSDKLLTAALEPSPVKDLRSCLPRTPIFVCKQCNQTFDELGKLLQHELDQHSSGSVSSTSNYQHQCKICHSTYRTVTLLNYHMKRHTPVKIPCKQCPKKFDHNADLEKHMLSEHCANMPLTCGVDGCTKTFSYKHHLKRHQTASHAPVQYICPECGCDMLTSMRLRTHMSVHRGTHSYKCPRCARTYLRRNSFRRHALREHKWDLTEAEVDKICCTTGPSRRSVRTETVQSD